MSLPQHTYGPTCLLSNDVTVSSPKSDDDIPALKAQFFYSSALPIDDPLTAVPTPSGSDSRPTKHAPRPFSAYDNNALEEAWLGLSIDQDRESHRKLKKGPLRPSIGTQGETRVSVGSELATNQDKKPMKVGRDKKTPESEGIKQLAGESRKCNKHLGNCACANTKTGCTVCPSTNARPGERPGSPAKVSKVTSKNEDTTADNDLSRPSAPRAVSAANASTRDVSKKYANVSTPRSGIRPSDMETENENSTETVHGNPFNHNYEDLQYIPEDVIPSPCCSELEHGARAEQREDTTASLHAVEATGGHFRDASADANKQTSQGFGKAKPTISGISEIGTTGFPFQRAPSRRGNLSSRSYSPSSSLRGDMGKEPEADDHPDVDQECSNVQSLDDTETVHAHQCKARKISHDDASVPVGISRLHLVKLPALQMMPIYWSPVHDIAAVTRGTWFYKDSMYPVEPSVANQLEIGYRELRPWSRTWSDELHSALEVGAAGEEKISYRIWPKERDQTDGSTSTDQILTAADPFCAARCFHGEVAAVGTIEIGDPDRRSASTTPVVKRFPNSHVIYKDSRNAFILKPSLQPSEYYGRKPLAKIKRGITVGIHVVRGFDWKAWEKLHEAKKSSIAARADQGAPVTGDAAAGKRTACVACIKQEKRPIVTDLVLVIHGIGQKLSERVESFHFTHAINSFRRSINVELGTDTVQKVLRDDLGGIMVLPVNWRSNLSFEDGGPMKNGDLRKDNTIPEFTLKDITPDTIPAVRNLVSDVMLDIPFYMSHHKPKMIEALVCEANRVYRLWCQNNPGFQTTGRVHIIAHSLGSAMALDVLSKQPTSVGPIDLRSKKPSIRHFEFDTRNVFFVGSPAGFFLLLNRGQLIPRRGRNKPDAEPGDDKEKGIAGEAGTFGCLAVDNLYNVMHCNDPVAYRLNATVDPLYAATLKNAQVPSATTGWIGAIGNAMRSITPGVSKAPELVVGQVAKPPVARLPSQLEMEVHDFTREEIAEKKLFLLNDNGQIDYFLSSGGGPLEIQYLNMLGAHSSYWISADFIRMVVTEVGREPGRSHCLPNMRVAKVGHK